MKVTEQLRNFIHRLQHPSPRPKHEPTAEQKREIAEAIRKQRFRGRVAARFEYPED